MPRASVRGPSSAPAAAARPAASDQKVSARTPAVRSIDQNAVAAAPQSTNGTKGARAPSIGPGPRRIRWAKMQTLAASQSPKRKAPPNARINSASGSGAG